jgi:excisionase family DNA binding protein
MEIDSQNFDPHEALSVKKIAELLHVSEPTVRGWLKSGDLPSLELNGCRRVFRKDLDDFLTLRRKYGLRPLGKYHTPPVRQDEWSGAYSNKIDDGETF